MTLGERTRAAAAAFAENARERNLRLAQGAFGAAQVVRWGFIIAVGIYAYRDGGAAAVGLVALARMVPAAIIAPFVAVLADRARRERMLLAVGVVRASSIALIALLVAAEGPPLTVYALTVVATTAHTLFRPAHSALLPLLCRTPLQLASANVVRGLLDSVAMIVGALLTGALLAFTSLAVVFAALAATAATASLLVAGVRREGAAPAAGAPPVRPLRAAREAAELLVERRDLALVTLLGIVQSLTRGAFAVFAVVVALELLRTGEPGVSILTGAVGVGAVAGSFAATLVVGGRRFARCYGAGVALWGLPFALIPLLQHEPATVALLAAVGVAGAFVDVGGFTVMQRVVPDAVMARVFTVFEGLTLAAVGVGSAVTPAVIAAVGLEAALVVVGLLGPVAAALAWPRLRHIDAELAVSSAIVATLQRAPMLRPLPLAMIDRLAASSREETVPAGTVAVAQGEEADDFYVIEDGDAAVYVDGVCVRTLGAGDCFGEIAALRRRPRTSTVLAGRPLRCEVVRGADFLAAVTAYPPAFREADALVRERLATSAPLAEASRAE